MKPQTFVFFGIVGSGKGAQIKLLRYFLKSKDSKEQVYIGTGDIFRKIIESSENNSDTRTVKEILDSGRLVPDEMTNKLVADAVKYSFSPEKHLIFDGYPRTINQSKFFETMMESYKKYNINIIFINISKEEAMKRNLLRGRHDDTKEGLAKRFDEYEKNVIPGMNYFKNKENYKIYTVNGEQTVKNVHEDIIKALNL